MIRSVKHKISYANTGKRDKLEELLRESKRVASIYLDYLWDYGYSWEIKDRKTGKTVCKAFDVSRDLLDHPRMLSNVGLESRLSSFSTNLSARLRKCILTQVLGMIGAAVEKQRKRLYQVEKDRKEGRYNRQLHKAIDRNKSRKPRLDNYRVELNSICADFEETQDGEFLGFLQLKSLGKGFPKLRIPVNNHRACNKYTDWNRKNSFLISDREIHIRYDKPTPDKRKEGKTLGCDQGLKTTVTLSDGTTVPDTDPHGYNLENVTKKLSRKKKGSKAFKQTQSHRKNLINYQINHTDFSHVKQINLEKIWNIRYKRRTNRYLSHWCNTLIRDKILKTAEEQGVLIKQQSSTYRSQRCCECGLVRKANRKGKVYKCSCGNEIDSDLNASRNHVIELPDIPYELRKLEKNRKGFYWKSAGFFELTGEELTVPHSRY